MKKKKITVIVLSCLLVALIPIYFFVIAPLINGGDDPDEPVFVGEGESLYYGKTLMMYPEIQINDLISLTINNEKGTVSFKTKISETSGKRVLALSDFPNLPLADMPMSALRVYTLNTQCESNEPLRDCTPEQMAQYGVTEATCKASYVIKYYENDVEKEQTVYIGNKTLSSDGSYFVSVKGRSVIYKIGSSLEEGLFIAKADFVNPLIAALYSDTDVVFAIERLMIGDSNATLPFIGINATKDESRPDSLTVDYEIQFPASAVGVTASANYISNALNKLLVSFTGDKVLEINPDDDTCKKYGFGTDAPTKVVSLRTYELKEYRFVLSQITRAEDGKDYYYLLTEAQSDNDVPLIIRIPATGYEFLESENAIKWLATNSVDSGFTKYINADEEEGESGVKQITIKTNTPSLKSFEETFFLEYSPHPTDSKKNDVLKVTSASGKYVFEDDLNAFYSEDRNQFNNFYAMLVTYPYPNRFNTMTDAQKAEAKKPENLILSIRVVLNDGTEMGYDYYKLDSASAMCEFFDEDTPKESPKIVFDTTVEHIDILANALKQLINGEKVTKQ